MITRAAPSSTETCVHPEALEAHQEEENDVAVGPDQARYGLTQRVSSVDLLPRPRGEVVEQGVRVGLGQAPTRAGPLEVASGGAVRLVPVQDTFTLFPWDSTPKLFHEPAVTF